ncbi:MAG: MFS transporter, partial [Burkholderiaceae bacterium]
HNARVIARASSWLAVAPICGPILGSWLQVAFGWRAAFVALTLFSAALLAVALLRLPETNAHKDPRATELAGVLANYRIVLGAREFWAHAAPGALSYGGIFLFISGMSLALIDILKVPTARFGYCFGFGVCGYLAGTMLCRRLLARYGSGRTLKIGTAVSLATGALFLAAVAAGALHWSLVVAAMFLTMGAHGLNFPVAQSGAVAPFPQQAATAAGLMGALYMLVAFVVGSALGASYDGTLYPMAAIACVLGVAIFCVVRALPGAALAAR